MRLLALLILLVPPNALAGELAPPKRIEASRGPIDVRSGNAAPYYGDLDNDGVRELLVGESHEGRLRLYRDAGTGPRQRFADYELLDVIADPRDGDRGMKPQLVDLDADGSMDLISGSKLGEVRWFRRTGNTTFGRGEPLRCQDGRPINLASSAFAVDWDADGDLDLLLGTVQEGVLLSPNVGAALPASFGEPRVLLAPGAEKPQSLLDTAPVAADWDSDGRLDLIVGALDGSVGWYRNVGTAESPILGERAVLVAACPTAIGQPAPFPKNVSGHRAQLCVVDWDEDSLLDLLVGDQRDREAAPQTENEKLEFELARRTLDENRKPWALMYPEYVRRAAEVREIGKNADADEELDELRSSIANLNAEIHAAQRTIDYYSSRFHRHGFVWLYLRRPG